jgi:Family of unknown function (DUF5996)
MNAAGDGRSDQSQAQWPKLPLGAWRDTCATLQLWTQVVGKIRLTRSPWLNHSWHVALYVTARGLSTSPIPTARAISRSTAFWVERQEQTLIEERRIIHAPESRVALAVSSADQRNEARYHALSLSRC